MILSDKMPSRSAEAAPASSASQGYDAFDIFDARRELAYVHVVSKNTEFPIDIELVTNCPNDTIAVDDNQSGRNRNVVLRPILSLPRLAEGSADQKMGVVVHFIAPKSE